MNKKPSVGVLTHETEESKPSAAMGASCRTSLLIGPSGSGKSQWFSEHLSRAVKVDLVPQEKDMAEMKLWRLGHLFCMDDLFRHLIDFRLQWSCPRCGQMRMQSLQSGISDQLKKEFQSRVHIGFPYSGPRDVLVDKGYWRIMSQDGFAPLPTESWIDADVLVDRLDMKGVDAIRLHESIEQCLVAGLGEIVVRDQNRRLVYGSRLRCDSCDLDVVRPKVADLLFWIKGKKERNKEWDAFYWDGVRVSDWLEWTALDWLAAHHHFELETWWSIWEKRLQKCVELGLGKLPLDRQLKNLSSGERTLAILGRCLEWSASGCDFIFEHPDALLSGPDLALLNRVMGTLGFAGNRVWVEAHADPEKLDFERKISIGPPQSQESFKNPGIIHVLDEWHVKKIEKQIALCRKQEQGGIWVWQGPRGAGKTQHMRQFFQAFDKRRYSFYRLIDCLDTDPWEVVSSPSSLIEEIGLWTWLVEQVLSTSKAKKGRFLPGHFDPSNPLGACSVCLGEREEEGVCQECQGTGLGSQALSLNLFGMSMADYLLHPIKQIYEKIEEHLPNRLSMKLSDCCTSGLAGYSGCKQISGLSLTQQRGLRVLFFLWNAGQPSLLGLDEPFRGLDAAFIRVVLKQMFDLSGKGSVIVCTTARADFPGLGTLKKTVGGLDKGERDAYI